MLAKITNETLPQQKNVYGLEIHMPDGHAFFYPYVSAFRQDAEELLGRLSRAESLSSFHLDDIVRDYLTALYTRKLQLNGLTT